jgi:hypothetical protein
MIYNQTNSHGYEISIQRLSLGLYAADLVKGGKLIVNLVATETRTLICRDSDSELTAELASAISDVIVAIDRQKQNDQEGGNAS